MIMMKYYMHLKEDPFLKIREGKKTIELRLYDEKRRKINVGDRIEFENGSDPDQKIVANVTALHTYQSFAKLYEALPLEKCGYAPHEVKEASASDMDAYYAPEEQKKYGVVGIEFEIVEII